MERNPFFSIVIPNWKKPKLLEECLKSLGNQSLQDFELIVVDDNSCDESADIAKDFGAKTIILPERGGFTVAANKGISEAKGEWVILLNNDITADPLFLEALYQGIKKYPEAGMFACKILFKNNPKIIDNTGHLIYWDGLNRGRGRMKEDGIEFDREAEVLFPSGCAGAYKNSLLKRVKGFDTWFKAYGDDADLGLRLRLLGTKCFYIPKAKVYHVFSASMGPYSIEKAYLVERNRIAVLIKDFPWQMVVLSPFWTMIRLSLQGYALISRRKQKEVVPLGFFPLVFTILKAWISAGLRLPVLLKQRKSIWKNSKLSSWEAFKLYRKFNISAKEIAFGGLFPSNAKNLD